MKVKHEEAEAARTNRLLEEMLRYIKEMQREAMFEEFSLQYQLPMLERFGLNCYGCCEPLDTRLELIKKIPRLRRLSISPWADLEISAESLEDKFVFSYKPNPSVLAALTLDEELVRNQLREAVRITKGCVLEIVMKDTHTVNHQPERIERWTEIAQEVAAEAVCALRRLRGSFLTAGMSNRPSSKAVRFVVI